MSEKQVIKYVKDRNIAEYNTKDGLGNKYFEALGSLTFCYTKEGLKYFTKSPEDYVPDNISGPEKETCVEVIKEQLFQNWVADIMTGEDFLESVESGCFIDYDGSLSAVYVDGYESNLGLAHKGICQGKFLVDGDVFKDICENHHVLVDWANK